MLIFAHIKFSFESNFATFTLRTRQFVIRVCTKETTRTFFYKKTKQTPLFLLTKKSKENAGN